MKTIKEKINEIVREKILHGVQHQMQSERTRDRFADSDLHEQFEAELTRSMEVYFKYALSRFKLDGTRRENVLTDDEYEELRSRVED